MSKGKVQHQDRPSQIIVKASSTFKPEARRECLLLCSEKGVILIALLWILVALSVIALSFSREGFVEVAAARNTQALEDSYFIARAGIAATIYQLLQKRFLPQIKQLEIQDTPDPIDLGKVTGGFANGVYKVDIQDESGKININYASEEQLHALLAAVGVNQQDADIIVDSIMDWRDPDEAHRLNGAEDDYYQRLNPPYQARNGRLDTVEELLLIKGVTPEYYYGYPELAPDGSIVYRYGLSRYCTVYSTSNRINVNFAPLPVLLSIPGMPPQAAQLIYERRQVQPFENLNDISRDLPVNLGPSTLPFLYTEQTGVYTLTASAHRANSKVQRVIRTVIRLDQNEKTRYQTLYWDENVPDYLGMIP